MKILFVSSEAYPLVKTGGLADVAGALPKALSGLGEDVRLLLPAYPEAREKMQVKGRAVRLGDPLGTGETRLLPGLMPDSGVKVWLLDCPEMFDRTGGPYIGPDGQDWPDNHLRFALLARAAAMIGIGGAMMGWQPDVIHANDWQTGLVPVYLEQWGDPVPPCVVTIHNIHYQGIFGAEVMARIGLDHQHFSLDGLEFHGNVSFLKAGLVFANRLTTVSPTYAREIQAPSHGQGLDGVIRARALDLRGVLNGVDYEIWNPENDPAIPARYSAARLGGKVRAKKALQQRFGLPANADAPLLGFVGRLAEQKGVDLLLDALPTALEAGYQLVIVGTGDPLLEARCRAAVAAHPDQVAAELTYDEELAHLVQAGSDLFAVPSRFEPCGLTQLYALRYGTLPVVRRTGGLADTVRDAGDPDGGTGFVFDNVSAGDLAGALLRARDLFTAPKLWREIQKRGMSMDYSWGRAAQSYRELYQEIA